MPRLPRSVAVATGMFSDVASTLRKCLQQLRDITPRDCLLIYRLRCHSEPQELLQIITNTENDSGAVCFISFILRSIIDNYEIRRTSYQKKEWSSPPASSLQPGPFFFGTPIEPSSIPA